MVQQQRVFFSIMGSRKLAAAWDGIKVQCICVLAEREIVLLYNTHTHNVKTTTTLCPYIYLLALSLSIGWLEAFFLFHHKNVPPPVSPAFVGTTAAAAWRFHYFGWGVVRVSTCQLKARPTLTAIDPTPTNRRKQQPLFIFFHLFCRGHFVGKWCRQTISEI